MLFEGEEKARTLRPQDIFSGKYSNLKKTGKITFINSIIRVKMYRIYHSHLLCIFFTHWYFHDIFTLIISMQKPSYLSINDILALVSCVTVWSNSLSITYGEFCNESYMRLVLRNIESFTQYYNYAQVWVKFAMTTLFCSRYFFIFSYFKLVFVPTGPWRSGSQYSFNKYRICAKKVHISQISFFQNNTNTNNLLISILIMA